MAEKITKETAEALYTGIIHDTGVFQYSCTGTRTMEIAGNLMAKGIDGTAAEYPNVDITLEPNVSENPTYYKVTVTSKKAEGVKVETYIRAVEPTEPEKGDGK